MGAIPMTKKEECAVTPKMSPQRPLSDLDKIGMGVQGGIAILGIVGAIDGFAHEPGSWATWARLVIGLGFGAVFAFNWRRSTRS
jgi:hypothetical protein